MNSTKIECRECGGTEFYFKMMSLFPLGVLSLREVQLRVCGTCGHIDLFAQAQDLKDLNTEQGK